MQPVLVVDDEPQVRTLLCRWVATFGYKAVEASNADDALQVIDGEGASVALCDVRMPGHDGLWLTGQIRDRHPTTAVILASGMDDGTVAARGAELGALDYLVKPFGTDRFAASLRRAVDWHRDVLSTREWIDRLQRELAERRGQLQNVLGGGDAPASGGAARPRYLQAKAIWGHAALTRVLEWRERADPEGYAAAERVARFAVSTARRLHLGEEQIRLIQAAAMVHDLGMLTMPPALVEKPADFTPEERALVRQHPLIAYNLLREHGDLSDIAPLVLSAQEAYGGRGYPQGLVGDQIPLASRILAVSVAYQAMTTPRPHRPAIPSGEAVLELCRCRDTQFDPTVVDAFIEILTSH